MTVFALPDRTREDIAPRYGRRIVVQCDRPGCDRAALMDPRLLFGSARYWPVAGRSTRFRCECGHRETRISWTVNSAQSNGPVSAAAIRLWF